jgi:hypothetical protein
MIEDKKFSIGDYNTIMSDRNLFNQTVYTPLSEAVKILEERQNDKELMMRVRKVLNDQIPEICKNNKCAIMSRQIPTPNYENRVFLELSKDINFSPVFFEYFDDKFTSNNKYKHSLGQLQICKNLDKNGNDIIEKVTIVDFNKYNGKILKEVKTLWGESLIDFHKRLFDFYNIKDFFCFNELIWYKKEDKEKTIDFYKKFFLLVTCYGILFETFLILDDKEREFTKNVVLPALESCISLTGIKPLIVPIPPMDLESEDFWFYQLPVVKKSLIK